MLLELNLASLDIDFSSLLPFLKRYEFSFFIIGESPKVTNLLPTFGDSTSSIVHLS